MNRKLIALAIALVAIAGMMVASSGPAQQVTPQQQNLPVQVQAPGNPLTLQTAFTQTSTGAAAANTITVAALAGKTIYVTGFEITGDGSTAGTPITITLAFGGTTVGNYSLTPGAIATLAQVTVAFEFSAPIVSPTVGTNCVLTVPSFGAGNTAASATIHGYYQ